MKKVLFASCVTALLSGLIPASAQQPTTESPAPTAKPVAPAAVALLTPLRVRFVLSKYQGEKKLSSLPYDLSVNAPNMQTRLRIGGDVPYRTSASKTDDKAGEKVASYGFRTVGTHIDCTAFHADGGAFRLVTTVSDDSVAYVDDKSPGGLSNVPRFRTFSVTNTLLLRDGQTTQMTTATDPITGEVMRVDVTLTVLK